MAIGSAVAWAVTSIAMRPIANQALWRTSVLRMLVCVALLLPYAAVSGALARALATPSAWAWLFGSTVASMVVGDSLYFLAAARIGIARALPIASSFPLLSTIGAVTLLGEPPTLGLLAGSAFVVAAVSLIGGERLPSGGRLDPVGLVLAGLAAVCWAAAGLFLGPALQLIDPIAGSVVRFAVGAVLFGAYVLVGRPQERVTARVLWLAGVAGVGTLVSALLFLGGIAAAGVARGVALNATSPVFTAILAALLLRERISPRAGVGVALSVVGTVLLSR